MKLSVLCVAAASLLSSFSASASTGAQVGAALGVAVLTQADQPAGEKPSQPEQPQQPVPDQPKEEALAYVKMSTTIGTAAQPDIIIKLNREKAPISVENFMRYVERGFYDGTIFHRVIPDFMIQGGGFDKDLKEKPGREPAIKNEWENGLKNKRGTIAMARLGDRAPNPRTVNSATSQFFINVKDNSFLDKQQPDGGAYAVFGEVIAGMPTVDKIVAVKTSVKNNMQDVPTETVTITKVVKVTAEEADAAAQAEKSGASSGG